MDACVPRATESGLGSREGKRPKASSQLTPARGGHCTSWSFVLAPGNGSDMRTPGKSPHPRGSVQWTEERSVELGRSCLGRLSRLPIAFLVCRPWWMHSRAPLSPLVPPSRHTIMSLVTALVSLPRSSFHCLAWPGRSSSIPIHVALLHATRCPISYRHSVVAGISEPSRSWFIHYSLHLTLGVS
jgi:hypothetical protein